LKKLHIMEFCLKFPMEKAIVKFGVARGDSQLLKIPGHSSSLKPKAYAPPTDPRRIRHHAGLNSVTQIAEDRGGKTTTQEYPRERRPMYNRKGPKAMQKVSAFGPAHAEQARKIYLMKGSHVLLSHHEHAQISTNGDQLHEQPMHQGQRVQYGTSSKKEVPLADMLEQNQTILKIVRISARPGKCTSKLRNSFDVEHNECARKEVGEMKPVNYKYGVGQKDMSSWTTLQILESLSSSKI